MRRIVAFGPALLLAIVMGAGLAWWAARGGPTAVEVVALLLITLSFVWITLSVSTVALALAELPFRGRAPRPDRGPPLRVALLVPIFNEATAEVMGNVAAMRAALEAGPRRHCFAFFVLSDTQDPALAADERRAVRHLRECKADICVHYRRRPANTDRKTGNLHDWIRRWGADWDAMLILDADSLMSGAAIRQLADAMSADPDAGLIQSFPVLVSSRTLFGRMQEFASSVYGWLPAEGLALWARTEGNYWGHNAIIRTRAFAESAHLPHLRGRGGRPELILSHDFVEAGLLRRAGWSVRFLPRPGGSYEESPATLVDYVLRDRRWCRGNMQHLRLLCARGFHPATRFHMLHGAVAYLLSPAWLAFLAIWAALLPIAGAPGRHSATAGPPAPTWPGWPEIGGVDSGWLLGSILALLLLPKIVAAGLLLATPGISRLYGGGLLFLATALTEIALAVLYAPILMVQQSKAVLRAAVGRPELWTPQRRGPVVHGWPTLLRFHWLEVALGAGMVAGMAAGVLSIWLSFVTVSLIAAPVLSRLSGLCVADRRPGPLRLDSPCSLRVPRVVRCAQSERERLRHLLEAEDAPPPAIAAE
jgi:membrane glycosyltransferase